MSLGLQSLRSRLSSLPHRSLALAALVVPLVFVAGGCKKRLYDFGGVLQPIGIDGGSDGPTFDLGSPVDLNDDVTGLGGGGVGGAAGGGGGGGAGGAGGGLVQCDPNSPDRQTDPFNCGTCLNNCTAPNSTPSCVSGQCQITCVGDFVDADKNIKNGCECEPTNGGVEICDGIDNNCNGLIDEGFDFQNDVNNCGMCNHQCTFPFAMASCVMGMCQQGACLPNYYDRDPTIPGCETMCIKTNGGVEICDGLDNDCNGIVDDNLGPPPAICKTKGVCAGTVATCAGQQGWVCNYPSTYQPIEDMSKGCDGLDNDCDGVADEVFLIGKPCTVGSAACTNTGAWVCDNTQPGDHRCNGTPKPPGIEVCNGIDDNCNGEVDELDSLSDMTVDDKVIYVPAQNVTMFAYEATRYDATASSHGFDSTRRPCAVPGKQPWTNVTKEEAEAACEKIGKPGSGWRLCTVAEWAAVCQGSGNAVFPYGNAYNGTDCNGYDYSLAMSQPAATIPTGAAKMCVSSPAPGVAFYDMSGNVKEWVITGAASTSGTGPYELRGGAYDIASFVDNSVTPPVTRAPGLQCDASTPAPSVPVRLPSVGFRCCRTGMLPP